GPPEAVGPGWTSYSGPRIRAVGLLGETSRGCPAPRANTHRRLLRGKRHRNVGSAIPQPHARRVRRDDGAIGEIPRRLGRERDHDGTRLLGGRGRAIGRVQIAERERPYAVDHGLGAAARVAAQGRPREPPRDRLAGAADDAVAVEIV